MRAIKMETSDGEIIEVLPIGAKIRHGEHKGLTGVIKSHEFHESGKISPLPYCVYWDDSALASKILGWFCIYPTRSEIEEI